MAECKSECKYKYYDGGKLVMTINNKLKVVEPNEIITISTNDSHYQYVNNNPRFIKVGEEPIELEIEEESSENLKDLIVAAENIKELRDIAKKYDLKSKDTSFDELKTELLKEIEGDDDE